MNLLLTSALPRGVELLKRCYAFQSHKEACCHNMPHGAQQSPLEMEGLVLACQGHVQSQVRYPFWNYTRATQGWMGTGGIPHAAGQQPGKSV